MSYDVVIEQVKALPEQLLTSVSAFIVVFLWSNYWNKDSIFFIVSDDYIDNLFPLGKIIVDFKKVEKAWINYKKWFFLCKILVFKLKKNIPTPPGKNSYYIFK